MVTLSLYYRHTSIDHIFEIRVANLLGITPPSSYLSSAVQHFAEHHTGLRLDCEYLRIVVLHNGSKRVVLLATSDPTWDWLENYLQCGHITLVEAYLGNEWVSIDNPSLLRAEDKIRVTCS